MKRNCLSRTIILAWTILQSVVFAQEPRPTIPDLQISVPDRLYVFDSAWETVNKKFFDPKFNGVNWVQIKEKYRALAEAATDKAQLVDVLQKMLNELHTSHMSVNGGFQHPTISEPPGSFRALEKGVVYLRFPSFTPGPGSWLADQVERNKSASTIVLDLRGNGGGSLETQLKVFDLFFSRKTVIGKFRDRKGKEYTLKIGGNKSAYQGRIIVLTDHSTQSAAEVFACGIQETGRGVVVGQQTYGGVLLGTHYKLPDRFDLHVALMDYHTLKGIRLEGHGVIPDVVVDLAAQDFRENQDAVLDRVRQMLQQP